MEAKYPKKVDVTFEKNCIFCKELHQGGCGTPERKQESISSKCKSNWSCCCCQKRNIDTVKLTMSTILVKRLLLVYIIRPKQKNYFF